ncbi:LysR substrate-binding domain-containing protein [Sinorhizobium meliloti]|uniref:LysR substrate-binding domain-containing protein n=1 Tax=Rhizobium meliloti TaxID=382 RepID=UPI0013E32B67|nr:LysR substrate-binding domain-containing protein [Sinorhizobium meliloti]
MRGKDCYLRLVYVNAIPSNDMRFSGLSIRQLEAFDMTMKAGSVSGAASAMHVSQPSVSRLLQDLEADTGLKLFDRSQGRLVPTVQGIMFHAEVAKSFSSARELAKIAEEIRELRRGVLRVGALPALSLEVLPAAMRHFKQLHPQTVSTAAVRSSSQTVAAVASHYMDVGIVDSGVSFLDTICVADFRCNNVCVMAADHPCAVHQDIGIRELSQFPFVSLGRDYLGRSPDGIALREAVSGNVEAETFQSFLACAFVRGSDALAVVDPFTARFYANAGLVQKPLRADIPFSISVVVNNRSKTSSVVEIFVDLLNAQIGHTV